MTNVDLVYYDADWQNSNRHLTSAGYERANLLIANVLNASDRSAAQNELILFAGPLAQRFAAYEAALAETDFAQLNRVVTDDERQKFQERLNEAAFDQLLVVAERIKENSRTNGWGGFAEQVHSGIKKIRKNLAAQIVKAYPPTRDIQHLMTAGSERGNELIEAIIGTSPGENHAAQNELISLSLPLVEHLVAYEAALAETNFQQLDRTVTAYEKQNFREKLNDAALDRLRIMANKIKRNDYSNNWEIFVERLHSEIKENSENLVAGIVDFDPKTQNVQLSTIAAHMIVDGEAPEYGFDDDVKFLKELVKKRPEKSHSFAKHQTPLRRNDQAHSVDEIASRPRPRQKKSDNAAVAMTGEDFLFQLLERQPPNAYIEREVAERSAVSDTMPLP